MKTYYNGPRQGMMYGGGAMMRKPMMDGGKVKKMNMGGLAQENRKRTTAQSSMNPMGDMTEQKKLSDTPFGTPKPERLLKRILSISTKTGDLVLDSFLGSATTAAVAKKMNRKFIGIATLCVQLHVCQLTPFTFKHIRTTLL